MNTPDNEDEDNDDDKDSVKVKISDNGDNNDDDDKKIPDSLLVEGLGGEAVAGVFSPPVHVYDHVVNGKRHNLLESGIFIFSLSTTWRTI